MRRLALPALALAMALTLPAATQAQTRWGNWYGWEIDRDANGCTMHQPYARDDAPRFAIRVEGGTARMQLSGKGWRFVPLRSYRIRLQVEGSAEKDEVFDATGLAGPDEWRGVAIPLDDRSKPFWTDGALVARIGADGALLARFAPPHAPLMLYWVDSCAEQVAAHDPGSGRAAATPPVDAGTESVLTFDDYPGAALRGNQQGDVTVRLTVSAKGRVSDCHIVRSSGAALLDQNTCWVLARRMRFVPARDAQGEATESAYDQAVSWRIPPEVLERLRRPITTD
jgi:TonB family protein